MRFTRLLRLQDDTYPSTHRGCFDYTSGYISKEKADLRRSAQCVPQNSDCSHGDEIRLRVRGADRTSFCLFFTLPKLTIDVKIPSQALCCFFIGKFLQQWNVSLLVSTSSISDSTDDVQLFTPHFQEIQPWASTPKMHFHARTTYFSVFSRLRNLINKLILKIYENFDI